MNSFTNYRQSLIPPYTARDLIPLLATLFFLLSIFLTLLLLRERADNRGRASEQNAMEAENAVLTGPVTDVTDINASGSKFIQFGYIPETSKKPITGSCAYVAQPGAGLATMTIDLSQTSTYAVWTRMMVALSTGGSYLLQIDDQCPFLIEDESGESQAMWRWVGFKDINKPNGTVLQLSSGTHVVKLYGIEPGVKIDRVLFIPDATCIPTDVAGTNCLPITPSPSENSKGVSDEPS